MARSLFIAGSSICLVCILLVQIADPAVFGIREEPDRILYYGGLGLLAGLSGLASVASGIYWLVTGRGRPSGRSKLSLQVIVLLVVGAAIVSLLVRLTG